MNDGAAQVRDLSSGQVDSSLLTVLTTEHFTLQGARGSTVSESSARAALYVGAVSSALIALGFLGQASRFGAAFDAFALVVLPTVYLLGLFTFVRLVQSTMEDLLYGRAINRIRGLYLQLAGEESRYFLLEGHDDVYGVLANMGIGKASRWQLYLTIASMVAVLNSVVGGTTVALVARLLDGSIAVSVFIGGVALLVSLFLHDRVQRRTHVSSREIARPLFPTVANEKSAAKQARTIPRPTSS
jgi:hypothetical protein